MLWWLLNLGCVGCFGWASGKVARTKCGSCRRLRSFDLLIGLGTYPFGAPRLLQVPPLRRVPFGKQPQKEPKRPRPSVRPSLRSGSLATAPLRGHAVTGHPWPNTALPASCRETHYAEPSLGLPKGPVDQKQKQKKMKQRPKPRSKCSCAFDLKN